MWLTVTPRPEGSNLDRPNSTSGLAGSAANRSADQAWDVGARHLASGRTLLGVWGVIDQRTGPLLEQRLLAEARQCPVQPPQLLLDLSGVSFLDRPGLDAVLRVQARVGSVRGTLELIEPTDAIIRLLHEADVQGEASMPAAQDDDGWYP